LSSLISKLTGQLMVDGSISWFRRQYLAWVGIRREFHGHVRFPSHIQLLRSARASPFLSADGVIRLWSIACLSDYLCLWLATGFWCCHLYNRRLIAQPSVSALGVSSGKQKSQEMTSNACLLCSWKQIQASSVGFTFARKEASGMFPESYSRIRQIYLFEKGNSTWSNVFSDL
jgi:hypothetical protein